MSNVLVRLAVYYLGTMAFFGGLFRLFPQILYYMALERDRQGPRSLDFSADQVASPMSTGVEGIARIFDPATTIPVVFSLLGAFALTLPVVWVYRWTRPRKRYNQSFAHTLLVVPIAIALIVFLVKGSLALAFSLAGIVAAVQFRTSLNETMDSVYMFIVIGIGLAAGVQLLNVGLLASLGFNLVALIVWKTDFGAQPAVLSGWQLQRPKAAGQLLGVSGVQRPGLTESADPKKPAFNARLEVQTTKVAAAQAAAIPILEANTKRWQMDRVARREDGTTVVVFDMWLKKSVDLPSLVRQIEMSEKKHVDKVEVTKHEPTKG